jgi:tetratricopeptide (TPR) repeat protein
MDHPNIAKVFDGGATASGRPYFVMELVKGSRITTFCDEQQLPIRERLGLFGAVCQAVQHAHQKGIIHRDLKPSNVLVSVHDTTPVVKIIDFGVAKALGQELTDKTLFTGFAQMIGTPLYMSPEQAGQSSLDVDTRSDIYSLGVLLYELLTGTTPFDKQRFKEAAYDEMRRIIREEEPPRPSARLSTLGQAATTASTRRRSDPKRLSQLFRGELDWIVMKCLEKDRNRRYETASALAADLGRYLQDEPVQACPPSVWYCIRNFGRRNKVALVTASVVVAALLAGIAAATWQAIVASDAKEEALAAARAQKQAKQEAEAREAETRAVLEFVENKVFAAARPEGEEGGLGHDVTLRKAVEAALPFVDQSFADQPLVEARLRMTMGTSFICLHEAKVAAEQFQTARTLYTKHLGPEDPHTLASMHNLALSYQQLGRYADALRLIEETLALHKDKLGLDHPDTLSSMSILAISYGHLGRYADAAKLHQEVLALRKAKLGPEHPDTLGSMNNLADSYTALGRHADAAKLLEEALKMFKAKLGPDHPDTLANMQNLAISYGHLGRYADAVKLDEETLALCKAKLGPEHPNTLLSMSNLGCSYSDLGRYADALKLHQETLALRKAKLGPDHPDTLCSMNNLANSYGAVGRYADALKLHQEALAIQKAKLGPDHPDTLRYAQNVANIYADLGLYADALRLTEETLALMKAKLGPDHPDTLTCMHYLAAIYVQLGRWADASKVGEELLALRKAKLGPDHPDTLAAMILLGSAYEETARYAEALKLREETLPLCKAKLGYQHPLTRQSMWSLANSYSDLGRHADALKLFEETLALQRANVGPDQRHTLQLMICVASSYNALGRHADALKLYEEALALQKAKLGPDHPNLAYCYIYMASLFATCPDHKFRDTKRAVELAKKAVELAPGRGENWNTLGIAYYRAGDFKASMEALERSMRLGKSRHGADSFFLAMAHWQLGRKEEARKWYDKAVAWMDKNQPQNDELRRFRAEAAKLLGIDKR